MSIINKMIYITDMVRKKFRKARRKRTNIMPNTQPSKKRKLWTEQQMTSALNEFKNGKLTIGKIAKKFQIPKTTLHNRISGRVIHGTKPGPKPYLQADEEVVLVDHLISAAKVGYGKTRKQVNMMVEAIAKEKGVLRKDKISNGWWRRFIERQPELSLRRADSTAHIRMDSINRESITEYFDLLESTLMKTGMKKFLMQKSIWMSKITL